MGDVFVDNIIQLGKTPIEKKWKLLTKTIMKKTSFGYVFDLLCDCSVELSGIQNKSGSFIFEGGASIISIADNFGLKPLGHKMRVCPFHQDKDPSLSLSEEKGLFNCFGCSSKGNIYKFYAMLKKLKEEQDGNK